MRSRTIAGFNVSIVPAAVTIPAGQAVGSFGVQPNQALSIFTQIRVAPLLNPLSFGSETICTAESPLV
jgi:thioredoxin-like negative regulator of GroEL